MQFLENHSAAIIQLLCVLTGGTIGFASSYFVLSRQLRIQKSRRRADYKLQGIQLAYHSLTHLRNLFHAKLEGPAGIRALTENPVDELIGLAALHLKEALPLIQKLHDRQQKVFGHNFDDDPDLPAYVTKQAAEFTQIVNEIAHCLEQSAKKDMNV